MKYIPWTPNEEAGLLAWMDQHSHLSWEDTRSRSRSRSGSTDGLSTGKTPAPPGTCTREGSPSSGSSHLSSESDRPRPGRSRGSCLFAPAGMICRRILTLPSHSSSTWAVAWCKSRSVCSHNEPGESNIRGSLCATFWMRRISGESDVSRQRKGSGNLCVVEGLGEILVIAPSTMPTHHESRNERYQTIHVSFVSLLYKAGIMKS